MAVTRYNPARFLILTLILFLLACALFSQTPPESKPQSTPEERAKWPLPPDLIHFQSASCVLLRTVKEDALNAKTGKLEVIKWVWAVQPTAQYDDHRQGWAYERKSGVLEVIGERASGHDAWDLCMEWIGFAKAAADEERRKASHEVKK